MASSSSVCSLAFCVIVMWTATAVWRIVIRFKNAEKKLEIDEKQIVKDKKTAFLEKRTSLD